MSGSGGFRPTRCRGIITDRYCEVRRQDGDRAGPTAPVGQEVVCHDVEQRSLMAGRLHGKVAIITGAARGQGAAAAQRFVAEGALTLLCDVDDDHGEYLTAQLGDAAWYRHL